MEVNVKRKVDIVEKYFPFIFCVLVSCIFVFLFSYSTSVLYPEVYGNDTAHFMSVAYAWLNGKVPYLEVFDHKGPLIYFIDMIALMLFDCNKTGISAIQIIFMCFSTIGVLYTCRLYSNKNIYGTIGVVVFLFAVLRNYHEGNSVEEYCLPFLVWSLYGITKWFMGKREEHNAWWALLYGITAGVCAMTRITNMAPICGGIFVISIVLLARKEVKNFFENVLGFMGGFIGFQLPFYVYFAIKGALKEMLYTVFLFNVEYSNVNKNYFIQTSNSGTIQEFAKNYYVFYIVFAIVIIHIIHNDWLQAMAFLISGALEAYIFITGFAFVSYPLVCAWHVVALLLGIHRLLNDNNELRVFAILLASSLCIYLHNNIYDKAFIARDWYNIWHDPVVREYDRLLEDVPLDERQQVIAYGGNEFKEFYIRTKITPYYKYYVIQDWITGVTPRIETEMHEEYKNGDVKWIIAGGSTAKISDVLESRYSVYDSTDNYTLYKLNE